MLAAKDDDERAARLVAAASRLRRDVGMDLAGVRAGDHERFVGALRSRLGPDRFAAIWAAGEALSLEEAIAKGLE